MKSTSWTCDNFCGERIVGDGKPPLWMWVHVGASQWLICSWKCMAEFAMKSVEGRALGEQITVSTDGFSMQLTGRPQAGGSDGD